MKRFFEKNKLPNKPKVERKTSPKVFIYLLSLASSSAKADQLNIELNNFNFSTTKDLKQFQEVYFYLKIEDYLVKHDPRYIGTKKELRTKLKNGYPDFTSSLAFMPLLGDTFYEKAMLSNIFLKFVVFNLIESNKSESLKYRWDTISFLDTSIPPSGMSLVTSINTGRKLKEKSSELFSDCVKSVNQEWAHDLFNTSLSTYKKYYSFLEGINTIEDLIPSQSKPAISANTISNSKFTQHNSVLENMLDGYILCNERGKILDFNTRATQIFNFKKEYFLVSAIQNIFPKEISQLLISDFTKQNITEENKILGKRKEILLHEGSNYEGFYEIAVTKNYTEQETYTIFIKDIGYKKENLDIINKAKLNAERTAKAKSEFLSNMSHEIRTPLNVILGLSDIIKKGDNLDLISLQKNIDAIDFSAKSLLSIVNDILDFSKIEAGKLSLQAIDFNIKTLLKGVSNGFEIKANEKGLKFNSIIDPNVPDIIIGDQYRLNQILTNLLGNALKFTHTGNITIKINCENETDENIAIKFEVIDTGIGIPSNQLDTIFESFHQVENAEHSKIKGTGLGLAICKKLVKIKGGELKAQSIEGKGTTFYFTIPFRKSTTNNISSKSNEIKKDDSLLEGLHILVAEDNKMNQFYIKQLLHKMGIIVTIAENGEEAVNLHSKEDNAYDLILMDMHMPVMNGLEAIKAIRNSTKDSLKKIPIVACTADVFPEARKKAIKAGIDFYLTKPLSEDAIKEVLFWLINETPKDIEVEITEYTNNLPNKESDSTINISQLLETFDNDTSFIVDLLSIFIKETPEDYSSLHSCFEKEYYARAGALAHKMKSSFMNLGMKTQGHYLFQIESNLLKKNNIAEAKKHYDLFKISYHKSLMDANKLLLKFKYAVVS